MARRGCRHPFGSAGSRSSAPPLQRRERPRPPPGPIRSSRVQANAAPPSEWLPSCMDVHPPAQSPLPRGRRRNASSSLGVSQRRRPALGRRSGTAPRPAAREACAPAAGPSCAREERDARARPQTAPAKRCCRAQLCSAGRCERAACSTWQRTPRRPLARPGAAAEASLSQHAQARHSARSTACRRADRCILRGCGCAHPPSMARGGRRVPSDCNSSQRKLQRSNARRRSPHSLLALSAS